ncbi:MAG TPA: HRDC domain-containing protein [Gammaproteobacteria bacterium]
MRTETLIGGDAELDELCGAVASADIVAIDTEFVRERTYYPQLCLVQVATESLVACVDCLADIELSRLFEALARPDLVWALHSGRQDLEVIRQRAGILPRRLIDTQIAAALAGHGAQTGLQEMLAAVLGVDIGKGYTRTDWSARPLPEGAIRYAFDDVRYLLPLLRRLEAQLAALGRVEWAAEDSARLLAEAARDDLLPIWARLKGVHNLAEDQRAAALVLVKWRERAAQRLDRPRRWIMSDELLARIAQARPRTRTQLAAIPDMPRRLAQRSGDEILAALAARDSADVAEELRRLAPTERPDREALKALQARVKERALELGILPEVLASRRELAAWLGGAPPAPLVSGWRAAVLEPVLGPATK